MPRLHPKPDDRLFDRLHSTERRLHEQATVRRPFKPAIMLERTSSLGLSAGQLRELVPTDFVETNEGSVDANRIDLPLTGIYLASGWIELDFVGAGATAGLLSILENPAMAGNSGWSNVAKGVSTLLPTTQRQSFSHVFFHTATGGISLTNLALINGNSATVGNFVCTIVHLSDLPGNNFQPL